MNEIIDKINTKHYEDAFSQFEKHFELLKDPFEVETYENRTGNLFEFVVVAGEMSKKADIVYFCSMILATSLNCFENAYSYSYGFAKKLININPYQLENWEWLLFFADVPDQIMTKSELEDAVINILKLDNQNKKALNLLSSNFTPFERSNIQSKTQIEHKKQSYDGYDIHYFVSGNPNGELVVFLHPAFSSHSVFDKQVDFFVAKYRVITIDLIGHGLSQVGKSVDKIDASARHISEIMGVEGYEKAHLVGVSMGSLVAQYFAIENPQKVLTLISLGGYDINKINPEVTKAQRTSNLILMLRALFSMRSFRASVAKIATYTPEGQAIFYNSASLYTRKSFLVMRGFEKIIKDRKFTPAYPTLILVGEHDIPLALQMAQTWHTDLPNSKYLQIDGAGHCANMDVPDIFNSVVSELLVGRNGEMIR